ncbi:hypothetical protein [Rhodococcoides corynebacterioides]|uniref:hypothetical protein n=1 Tax=Rhodococcoides corynebacterioides TaxID=53972 RepID=UPI0027DFB16E|nr:hypothetical protein [Rhodococcus corynebacterioides]
MTDDARSEHLSDPVPYTTGERVFGPPGGTFDPDWAATALRSHRPDLTHADSVRLVERAWELLRENGLRDAALADAVAATLTPDDRRLADTVAAVATETARFYLDR